MKKKQLQFSKLKKNLRFRKEDGKKFVIWKLSKEQKDYVVSLGYDVIPELYQITTRYCTNYKNSPSILKQLHHAKKNGKNRIVRRLKKEQLKLLNKLGINYYPIKYKIIL